MARAKKRRAEKPDVRTALSLTMGTFEILSRLAQDASDDLRWKVSGSAVARALLKWAGEQGEAWAKEHVFPLIEAELIGGVVWGKRARKR